MAVVVAFVVTTVLPTPGPPSRSSPRSRPAATARDAAAHRPAPPDSDHRWRLAGHPVGVSRGGEGHSIVEGSARRRERASQMTVRPARLNAAIAWLFMVGSACFVLGSVPAYARRGRRAWVDGITYFVGSIFFTSASYCQLVQAQSPATTGVDAGSQHGPARCGCGAGCRTTATGSPRPPSSPARSSSTSAPWPRSPTTRPPAESDRYVWRPDLFGSVLFLVASAYGILAVSGRFLASSPARCRGGSRGSTCSARCSSWPRRWRATCCPSTDEVLDTRVAVAGTLLGAVCFLVGAALMFPAWRRALEPRPRRPRT